MKAWVPPEFYNNKTNYPLNGEFVSAGSEHHANNTVRGHCSVLKMGKNNPKVT